MAANLMGADESLRTYADVAAEYGLTVTSGKRPGSITSSGNVSWHASGDALDVSGPADKMRAFFDHARKTWGAQLEELIYTPAGAEQIKNGQPYTYTGQVAADHFDHVHIADTEPASGGGGPVNVNLLTDSLQAGVDTATDAAGSVIPGGSVITGLVDALKSSGARLLLEIALILGGATLALWGLVRLSGARATDVASFVPAGRAAKGAKLA